jgi:hypothetical protein
MQAFFVVRLLAAHLSCPRPAAVSQRLSSSALVKSTTTRYNAALDSRLAVNSPVRRYIGRALLYQRWLEQSL